MAAKIGKKKGGIPSFGFSRQGKAHGKQGMGKVPTRFGAHKGA